MNFSPLLFAKLTYRIKSTTSELSCKDQLLFLYENYEDFYIEEREREGNFFSLTPNNHEIEGIEFVCGIKILFFFAATCLFATEK